MQVSKMQTQTAKAFSAVALILLLATLAGCGQQLGALLYHSGLLPEDKTKTQFKLSQNKLAILIDDPTGALPRADLRDDIQSAIVADLMQKKAAVTIVSTSELARVERANRDYDNMSIRAIGEQVQADQVLYVQIQSFTVGDEAKLGVYQGRAKALVKVCSTLKKPDVRLWPLGGDGQPVEVSQPGEQTEQWNAGAKASDTYSRMISARLGKRIAMLFYDHATEDEQNVVAGRNERPK